MIGADKGLTCWGDGRPPKRVDEGVVACDAECVVYDTGKAQCGRDELKVPPVVSTSAWLTAGCGLTRSGDVHCWGAGDDGKALRLARVGPEQNYLTRMLERSSDVLPEDGLEVGLASVARDESDEVAGELRSAG